MDPVNQTVHSIRCHFNVIDSTQVGLGRALKVAIQTNTEEEHGQERKLVGAEGLRSMW